MARNAVAFGLVPGALSEVGGQVFEGGAMETPARVGGALIGGFGAAAAMRPSVAGGMVRETLENVTPQQIDAAEQLFQRAQRLASRSVEPRQFRRLRMEAQVSATFSTPWRAWAD
jgi:hypothetical protein